MRQNTTSETLAPERPIWMLRFTAAAALVFMLAMSGSASAQLSGLPIGVPDPELPQSPISAQAGASAETPAGSVSANADESGASACVDAHASSSDVGSAAGQAQGAAAPVTGLLGGATGALPGLPSADLPEAGASADACADVSTDDVEGQVDGAKGKATGLIGQIKGLAGKISGLFGF